MPDGGPAPAEVTDEENARRSVDALKAEGTAYGGPAGAPAAAAENHGPVVRSYNNDEGRHVNVFRDGTEQATGSVKDTRKEGEQLAESLARFRAGVKATAAPKAGAVGAAAKLSPVEQRMVDIAKVTLPHLQKLKAETQAMKDSLGPLMGRWNDLWTGKIGAPNKTFAHYRDEMGFLDSAITLAHSQGRVSQEIYATFRNMFDAAKESPENIEQALDVATEWMQDYANLGQAGAAPAPGAEPKPAPPGPAKPTPKTGKDFLDKYSSAPQ